MNCDDFKSQLHAYALAALEADEARAMGEHLASPGPHEGCRHAFEEARATVLALGVAVSPAAAGASMWSAIEKRVAPPRASVLAFPRAREAAAWIALAAAVGGLYFARQNRAALESRLAENEQMLTRGVAVDHERQACLKELENVRGQDRLEQDAVAMLEDPRTRVVAMQPANAKGLRATALVAPGASRALIVASAAPVVAGIDYELWVLRGTAAPIPAGFLRHRPSGLAIGEIDAEVLKQGGADALAVSQEPEGGRPSPTEVVMIGKLKS